MSRTPWISIRSSGKLKFYRMKIEYGLSVGHVIEFPFDSVLEEIELSWRVSSDPDFIFCQVEAYNDLSVDEGQLLGPTNNIAGLFSFEAQLSTQKLLKVHPGALDMNFVLATLQESMDNDVSVPKELLMTLMMQDAVVAAEEIAHEVWNELVVSGCLIDSSSASTPRPVELYGETRLLHKISTETDCVVAFRTALHRYASKLSRYVSYVRGPAYSPPGSVRLSKGGEESRSNRPYRTSRGNRTFNASRAEWSSNMDQEILDTAQAISSNDSGLRVDSAREYQTYLVVNDRKRRPLMVETHRHRRCMFRFGPHIYLVTGARFGMTWVASWRGSPFNDKAVLMKEVKAFSSKAEASKKELSTQYIYEDEAVPARDVRLVEAAFRTCLQPLRDSLAPVDIELAMKRLGHEADSDRGATWFDNLRKYDADGTGFMELNEFYLFSHELTDDELRELTLVTANVLVLPKHESKAHGQEIKGREAVIQLDALCSKVSFFFNQREQKMKPLERELAKRPADGIFDLEGISDFRRHHNRGKWIIEILSSLGDEISMVVSDQDVDLVDRVCRWIQGLTQFREDSTDLQASPGVFMSLAHSAVHSILS